MIKTSRRARIILFLSAAIVLAVGIAAFVFLRTFDLDYNPNARDYVIFDGDKVIALSDCVGGADEAIERAKINVGNADVEITDEEDATIITVERYPAVLVSCDGEETFVSMKNATVGDVIERLGITLADIDTLNYSADEPIADGMKIKVGRVTISDRSVDEDIPFETLYENDSSLEKGKVVLKNEGKTGVLTTTYRYTYENGLLVAFEVLSREVTTEKTDEVYSVGTKEQPKPVKTSSSSGKTSTSSSASVKTNTSSSSSSGKSTASNPSVSTSGTGSSSAKDGVHSVTCTVDTDAKTITTADGTVYNYSKSISMTATAYSYDSNPAMNITSSGVPVQVGVVAALPKTLPQGTKVYIVGASGTWEYGFATVGDKPGSDIIDLFMETEKQCNNFGVRSATVYVVG
ncbi:MAG: G5 domain-containing protein [Oscillospiraceae bacterium]|nr:G5 domain-containing protein [Oscillospiraceae bacterium]